MKRLGIAILTIAVLLGGAAFYYSFPNHRFRLTIEIDTPDGVKSGSSVIAVYSSNVSWGLPEARGYRSRMEGEAVFVDLGTGRHVIALLAHGKGAGNLSRMASLAHGPLAVAAQTARSPETTALDRSSTLGGSFIPTLVTFADLADPATAKTLYATEDYQVRDEQDRYIRTEGRTAIDEIEATFGSGYRLKRVRVELTRDRVTSGIKQKVPWIGNYTQETIFEKKLRESGASDGSFAPGENLKRG